MTTTMKMVKAYFESKGFNCSEYPGREGLLYSEGNGDNIRGAKILLDFTSGDGYVSFRSYNLCKFSEDKKPLMYKVCSDMNGTFKWVKFFVDESDNTITCRDDAIIQLDSAGPECYELTMRMFSIMDDAYPIVMKAVWQ